MGVYRTLGLFFFILPLYGLPPQVATIIQPVSSNISLVVTHLGTNYTYSWRPNQRYNPASLIKLPILACLYNRVASERASLSNTLMHRARHTQSGAGILKHARHGEVYRLDTLANMMMRYSDNTATLMLIEYLDRQQINDYMRRIGMQNTWLKNPHLTQPPQSNQTTAMDIHQLLVQLARYELLSPTHTYELLSQMRQQIYRWGIPHWLPPSFSVANKTGTLGSVRHDVGLVIHNKDAYVVSILTEGLPKGTRAATIARIAEAILINP